MSSRQTSRNRRNVTPAAKSGAASAPSQPAAQEPVASTGAYKWTHDYDYVKKDLRKLGIVSSVLFLAIIIAGFFF
jgi:hypothetical protein